MDFNLNSFLLFKGSVSSKKSATPKNEIVPKASITIKFALQLKKSLSNAPAMGAPAMAAEMKLLSRDMSLLALSRLYLSKNRASPIIIGIAAAMPWIKRQNNIYSKLFV